MNVDIIGQSQQALSSINYATSIASENINNASNPHYARQMVQFGSEAGMLQATPIRMSNDYLNSQVYMSKAGVAYSSTAHSMAKSVDSIVTGVVTNPDGTTQNPLQSALNGVNEALVNLISDDNDANRTALISRIETFLGTTQTISDQLSEYEKQLSGQIGQTAEQVNQFASDIAKLNEEIASNPNDPHLLTQRDEMVGELSTLVEIDVNENQNGTVDISIAGGLELVRGNKAHEIEVGTDEFGDVKLTLHGIDISDNPEKLGGTLGGALYSLEDVVKETERLVSKVTLGFIAELNKANREGYTSDGIHGRHLVEIPDVAGKPSSNNTGDASVVLSLDEENVSELSEGPIIMSKTAAGYEFYDESTGENVVASTLPADVFGYTIDAPTGTMNDGDSFELDPLGEMASGAKVVASPDDIAAAGSLPVADGDNSNLQNLSDVFKDQIFDEGTDSVVDELADVFVQIGNNTQEADSMLQTASALSSAAMANWSSYSGVSIQEEELNMLQYQQVFQSVSKVISTADEMMDSLLNAI